MTSDYQQRLLLLHLSLIETVGPAAIALIMRTKPDHLSWNDLYSFSLTDWISVGISPKIASTIHAGLSQKQLLDQELTRIDKHQIQWVTLYDDIYPTLLKHINQPPAVLYFKGAPFTAHTKNIAIVGSRAADSYAQRVIDLFVPSLVAHQWSIISGGALGADSMAHRAALQAQGKTVAVLGSGLLQPYPHSNKTLFNQIVENGGTMVSSFPLMVQPLAGNFPARNRIIAGLSSGCIVVQAAHKSGASITAQYALDQGRSVFAVPGMIDNPLSAGCHSLLQEGASVAGNIQDILTELGESTLPISTADAALSGETRHSQSATPGSATKTKQLTIHSGFAVHTPMPDYAEKQPAPLATNIASSGYSISKPSHSYPTDSLEARIIQLCTQPCSIDEIAAHYALSSINTQQVLFDLQLEGLIRQNFAGQWIAVI